MSLLGYANPFHRVAAIVRGLIPSRTPSTRRSVSCLVIGHRGAARIEPENTIVSFQRALALGADAIETDVTITADGCFALWHDADPNEKVALARQLGGEGLGYRPKTPPPGSPMRKPVRQLRADELRAHYGYVKDEGAAIAPGAPERVGIAFLEDLLAWMPAAGLRHVFLDLKFAQDQQAAATALVAVLREARKRMGGETRFHLLSPQAEIVAVLLTAVLAAPDANGMFRVSADFELPGAAEIGQKTGARDVSLGGARLWPGFRADVRDALRARDLGRFDTVVAWTINEPRRLEQLIAAGIDGVITDEPALLRRLVGAGEASG